MTTPEQLMETIKAREAVIDRLYDELERKGRQLAEARRLFRLALRYGVKPGADLGRLAEGCAADTRKALEERLPQLDDRTAKRRRRG